MLVSSGAAIDSFPSNLVFRAPHLTKDRCYATDFNNHPKRAMPLLQIGRSRLTRCKKHYHLDIKRKRNKDVWASDKYHSYHVSGLLRLVVSRHPSIRRKLCSEAVLIHIPFVDSFGLERLGLLNS